VYEEDKQRLQSKLSEEKQHYQSKLHHLQQEYEQQIASDLSQRDEDLQMLH
jgi:hypothetical protein